MKKVIRHLILLTLLGLPVVASAQANIKKAFDAIIHCKQAQIAQSHSLDKDPVTNKKSGQCDIYNFVLPDSKISLVNDVVAAFNKDSELAYSIRSGTSLPQDQPIVLATGDDADNGIQLSEWNSDYMYALFIAPTSEDREQKHRYAYGLSYKNEKGKIIGKLLITYATTLKARQESAQKLQPAFEKKQRTWFEQIMHNLQMMEPSNSAYRFKLASNTYSLIQDSSKYPEVTAADRYTVREVLKAMISDKKYYSDPVVYSILNRCLITLE